MRQHTTEWDLCNILTSVIEAWESIPRELIIFSFQRTHFRTDDCFLQINCDFWNSLKLGISFKRFVTFDDDLSDRPTTYKKIDRYHRYKIPKCKNVIEINDDPLNWKFKNTQSIKESIVQKLSNESVRNFETMPMDLKKHTCRKFDRVTVTSHEKNNNATVTITQSIADWRKIQSKQIAARESPKREPIVILNFLRMNGTTIDVRPDREILKIPLYRKIRTLTL